MKTPIATAAALLALAWLPVAADPVPIDLNAWSKRGPAGNGNWIVAADGSSVLQTVNGDPTFFVSDSDQINTTLRGKIRVETTGDDDLIGFVFGFKGPASTGNDMDFLLFDWKQASQASGGFTAFEGFALSRVQGTITNYTPGFWGRTDSAGFDNLATNYGDTLGWADNVEYDFEILYQTSRIRIDIAGGAFGNGTTVFDVAGNFEAGRFGFYNYSQAQVRYSGLTEQDTPPDPNPVPAPGSLALAGLALMLVARQRTRSQVAVR
ncbi:MAG: hypothetical protein KIS83_20005 [Rubrivivax sp.]|nr:hypothetical protein [Rubrivivax sp.]MCW5612936.1 hypothetical protein [Rubrivivax sp.]